MWPSGYRNWLKVGTKIVDNWWIAMLVNGVIHNYRVRAYWTLLAFCRKHIPMIMDSSLTQ